MIDKNAIERAKREGDLRHTPAERAAYAFRAMAEGELAALRRLQACANVALGAAIGVILGFLIGLA